MSQSKLKVLDIVHNKILTLYQKHINSSQPTKVPFIVGIQGVQGSGKTTLCKSLTTKLNNLKVVTLSMDDFYYPYNQLKQLEDNNKDNLLLKGRGYPLTYDYELLVKCLNQLLQFNNNQVRIPQFDKGKNKGKGDRLPIDQWLSYESNPDLILIEGWLLGYLPLKNLIKNRINESEFLKIFKNLDNLIKIDLSLSNFQLINNKLNYLIKLIPNDLNFIFKWRNQQEISTKFNSNCNDDDDGMSRHEVDLMVNRFMPAYHLYLNDEEHNQFKNQSILKLDEDREIINIIEK